jgi:hypothetical protein
LLEAQFYELTHKLSIVNQSVGFVLIVNVSTSTIMYGFHL